MTQLELLAPAKNLQYGIAAIDHGADAVYIGAHHFGARAAAGNSVEDIKALCAYAHQFGARVYVTVNTLIRDDEEQEVKLLLQQLASIPVDAILVQDMKLLSLAQGLPLTLHASTQADNRTAERVGWLQRHGFSRAVLARELSIAEVAAIHQQCPDVELEVFVHGALCVSYSGRCYASEYCFHRSANRGECAQFCRMKFDLLDAENRELGHQRYYLSLKDLNLSDKLGRLIEAGACSFKIEGRLKDLSYVKNVTAAYSQLLNQYIAHHPHQYERSSKGRCQYSFTPDLERTFHRGYTSYFSDGRHPDMASFNTPKALGQCVGQVKELRGATIRVSGIVPLANGDGLCFFNGSHDLCGFRVNRVEGNLLFPQTMPRDLKVGMRLYRSNDYAFDRLLSRESAVRKIPISMSLRTTDEGLVLRAEGVEVYMPMELQQAKTPQREAIITQLSRLGGTPYLCTGVDLPDDFNFFIPLSQLSSLRRLLCEKLSERGMPQDSKEVFCAELSDTLPPARSQSSPLMECRYCLRYELGYCVRHGGQPPQWKEPLRLRLADGRCFRLKFDCVRCQMNVYADEQ